MVRFHSRTISSKFNQILQYLTNVFNLELVDLSTADLVSVYLYTAIWFVTERFVFFMLFFVFVWCVLLIVIAGFNNTSKSIFINVCIFLSIVSDLLLVLFSLIFIFIVKSQTKFNLFSLRISALDFFSTWSGDLSYRMGTLLSVGHTSISFCTDITSFIFIISSLVIINSCLVFYRPKNSILFIIWLFLLKFSSTAAFSSADIFSFTIFMEMSSIIVLCLYVGSYQTKRSKAALHYVIYTSVSGVLLIAASFYLASKKYSIMFDTFCWDIPLNAGVMVGLAVFIIFIALAIKIPVGPFYHWLLFAHVEASTPVSIVLAAILLKIPAVAILRVFFNSGLVLPDVLVFVMIVLCISTIVACSSAIWLDGDVKGVVALSSVVHMTGSILILFSSGHVFPTFTTVSVILSLVSHTFLSALMFAWCGVLSERYHTRDIFQLSGVLRFDTAAVYFTFLMCFFIGAVPISFVFTAEAYTILVLGVSYQFLILLFTLMAYSVVFIRVLYISCKLIFGRSSIKFSYQLNTFESSIFILFALCLIMTIFMDGGIVSTMLLWSRSYMPISLKNLELRRVGKIVFGRFLTKRSPRHKYASKTRRNVLDDRDANLAFETISIKRRRRIRFYLNLMKFRNNLGVLGRGSFTSGPVKFDYSIPFNNIDKHYFINFDINRGLLPGSVRAKRAEMLLNYSLFFPPYKPYLGNIDLRMKYEKDLLAELAKKKSSIAKEKAELDRKRVYDTNRRLFGDE